MTDLGRQTSATSFGRWLVRTVVGGTTLGIALFVVYLLVAIFR